MKRQKLEVVEEDKFVAMVNDRRYEIVKLSTQGYYGKNGYNDRLVMAEYGVTAVFEFKRVGKHAEPLQKYRHKCLRRLGHNVYVVYTAKRAMQLLDNLINKAAKNEVRKTTSKR